eukprot:g3199.t1 g3199   contig12:1615319-1616568(+)
MQGMCWNTSVFVAVVLFRLTSSFVPSGDIWASIRCRCNDVTFANIHRPYYNLTPRRRSSESASPRDESDEIIQRTEFIQRTSPLSRREMISLTSHTLPMLWAIDAVADESTHSQEEPKVCRNGGIVAESAVPGAYQQTCMNLDERSFLLKSTGDSIIVEQGTNAAGGMAGRTGVAVWNSAIVLVRLLDELNKANASIFKDKAVLELGCGTGLTSIAMAKMGAQTVYATDANPEVLSLAKRNIERNNAGEKVEAVPLQWGLMDATEYDSAADIVIGSDLTYNSGSWLALSETMATVLKPGGIVIYLTLGHSGFNVGGELGGFLSVAENSGLSVLTKRVSFGSKI